MKKKYHGIATLAIGIVAIGSIAGYYGSGAWQSSQGRSPVPAIPGVSSQIKVPTTEQVKRMSQLYDRMNQLAVPTMRDGAVRPLTLFGYEPDSLRADQEDDSDAPDRLIGSNMRLTLTVLAGIYRYCIFDGRLLTEGTLTPYGGKIVKIEAHRVLVALGQERRWFYIEEGPSASAVHQINRTLPGKGQS